MKQRLEEHNGGTLENEKLRSNELIRKWKETDTLYGPTLWLVPVMHSIQKEEGECIHVVVERLLTTVIQAFPESELQNSYLLASQLSSYIVLSMISETEM